MRRLFAVLACSFLAACGTGGHASGPSASASASPGSAASGAPAKPLHNPLPIAFPPEATLLDVSRWSQDFKSVPPSLTGIIDAPGQYAGRQVIASSSESFARTDAWLQGLAQHLPPGYHELSKRRFSMHMRDLGLDAAAFSGGGSNGILVVAIDVRHFRNKLGLVLGLLKDYTAIPSFMRAPLDKKIEAQTGISPSELLDPRTPIGSAVAALHMVAHDATGRTAIVMFDAGKAAK